MAQATSTPVTQYRLELTSNEFEAVKVLLKESLDRINEDNRNGNWIWEYGRDVLVAMNSVGV